MRIKKRLNGIKKIFKFTKIMSLATLVAFPYLSFKAIHEAGEAKAKTAGDNSSSKVIGESNLPYYNFGIELEPFNVNELGHNFPSIDGAIQS